MQQIIDSHCHLDLPAFEADLDEVIARAESEGVAAFVVPAVSAGRWHALRDLCESHSQMHPAYGLHPLFMDEHADSDLDALDQWLRQTHAVAVGECGLDFHCPESDQKAQCRMFEGQLDIAREHDLPVILHARKALDQVTAALRRTGNLRGVLHSFSGSEQQAGQLIELGFHLGIGGPVTYPRARRLRRIVADMPLEHLLLETDSPDQPLCGHQGQRNEPVGTAGVLACVAELRGADADALAAATTANARKLFALPD